MMMIGIGGFIFFVSAFLTSFTLGRAWERANIEKERLEDFS